MLKRRLRGGDKELRLLVPPVTILQSTMRRARALDPGGVPSPF